MGSGTFNTRTYRAAVGNVTWDHHANTARSSSKEAHPCMDVSKKPYRECRDPEIDGVITPAYPIAILQDVTGSMRDLPRDILEALTNLMVVIKDKGIVKQPALCFGAIGDAYSDMVPVQIGEFESCNEKVMESLSSIYMEGNGGGQAKETYELLMYFFAKQVYTDNWDLRGQKGCLFIIGDEGYYPEVNGEHLHKYLGLEEGISDIPTEEIAKELQERWNVYHIRLPGSAHFNDSSIHKSWENLLGPERVISVQSVDELIGTIAGIVSILHKITFDDFEKMAKEANVKVPNNITSVLASISDQDIVDMDLVTQGQGATRT